MRYEDTGNFNDRQKKLIKEFQKIAKKLKESGCVLVSSDYFLNIFLKKDWEYAKSQNNTEPDHNYPLINESIEIINGGWDDMYFPVGCIDED